MSTAPVLELHRRKMLECQGLARGSAGVSDWSLGAQTAMEEERREVLDGVRRAMAQKTLDPARSAACHFLLRHLSGG